ncbi:CBS domain-containing protein [Thiothrix eikelboomii]|uniref:CBS domain-containing protein n=1 Tax=Thiothrix eikelboomii TaxID=92487 RepID=A0A1T4W927_9GAMM|nr:CBS domain-containing protein [Thiothrix eikelboomii]SKA73495.1 CBS domain-containing protein [Thiothrix eikelboomii]
MALDKQDFLAALQDYSEDPPILLDELWRLYQSALHYARLREQASHPLSELMHTPVTTISPDHLLAEASQLILEQQISGLPVIENNRLVGIITEGDLMAEFGVPARTPQTSRVKKALDSWLHPHMLHTSSATTKVREMMTHTVVTAEPNDTLGQGLELLRRHQVTRLVIVDKQHQVVGIVTRSDILRFTSAAPHTTPPPPTASAS